MPRYLVYNTTLPNGSGSFLIVRWGRSPTGEFNDQIIDTGDTVINNTWLYEPQVSTDPTLIINNWFNPTTFAFSTTTSSSIIGSTDSNEAVNFLAQAASVSTASDRLLRYFGNEGSFGLGSTVPTQITDFTAASPPTGFYYCVESTVVGGPASGAFNGLIMVQRGISNGVLFIYRRVDTVARQWMGVRTAASGSVTWVEMAMKGQITSGDVSGLGTLATLSLAGIANGGTGQTSGVLGLGALRSYTTTATAAGTTTLTSTSTEMQVFTGTTTQTIVLPAGATMVGGSVFTIVNQSTGTLTINSNNASLVTTVTAGAMVTLTFITGGANSPAAWDVRTFGTIASQAASGVAITGGTINGASIGATTPASVRGSSLTSTSVITDGVGAKGTVAPGALAFAATGFVTVTPNATGTFTSTVPPVGTRCTLVILTSGTTSFTLTFGTGFLSAGTLATGTVTAKRFVVEFVSDGTFLLETRRTAAL